MFECIRLSTNVNFGMDKPYPMQYSLHHEPGYRVYFMQRGPVLVVLLAGGTKAHQQRDIEKAKELAQEL